MTLIVVAAATALSTTANAQTRNCNSYGRTSRVYRSYGSRAYNQGYNTAYENRIYEQGYSTAYGNRVYDQGYYTGNTSYGYGQPSVYDRHRKAVNIGVGTGAGALLGALIGGGKGAVIGAAAGAAGGAIVTNRQSPRNYYRYRR